MHRLLGHRPSSICVKYVYICNCVFNFDRCLSTAWNTHYVPWELYFVVAWVNLMRSSMIHLQFNRLAAGLSCHRVTISSFHRHTIKMKKANFWFVYSRNRRIAWSMLIMIRDFHQKMINVLLLTNWKVFKKKTKKMCRELPTPYGTIEKIRISFPRETHSNAFLYPDMDIRDYNIRYPAKSILLFPSKRNVSIYNDYRFYIYIFLLCVCNMIDQSCTVCLSFCSTC